MYIIFLILRLFYSAKHCEYSYFFVRLASTNQFAMNETRPVPGSSAMNEARPTHGFSIKENNAALLRARYITGLTAGFTSGALRLELLNGVLFYLGVCSATTLLFVIVSPKPQRYFTNPLKNLAVDGVVASFLPYLVSWTVAYSLVVT